MPVLAWLPLRSARTLVWPGWHCPCSALCHWTPHSNSCPSCCSSLATHGYNSLGHRTLPGFNNTLVTFSSSNVTNPSAEAAPVPVGQHGHRGPECRVAATLKTTVVAINSIVPWWDPLTRWLLALQFGAVTLTQPSLAWGAGGPGHRCAHKAAPGTGDEQEPPLSPLGCEMGSVPPAAPQRLLMNGDIRLSPRGAAGTWAGGWKHHHDLSQPLDRGLGPTGAGKRAEGWRGCSARHGHCRAVTAWRGICSTALLCQGVDGAPQNTPWAPAGSP